MFARIRAIPGRFVVALIAATLLIGVVPSVSPARAATAVSVTDYGAKGDGHTDDTASFQAAVDAAVGKVLQVPAGNYVIGQVRVTQPLTLQGAGKTTSIITRKAGNTQDTFIVVNTHGVIFTDLGIEGGMANPLNGSAASIQFDNATQCQVLRSRVANGGGISVYNGSDHGTIADCVFEHNENDVVFHASAYGMVTGCTSTRSTNEAFTSYDQSTGSGGAHDNQMIGNTISDAWSGIAFQRSYNNVARDNHITNTQWGISVYANGESGDNSHDNTVENNTFVGGANNKSWAILVETPSHDNIVRGNTVTGWQFEPVSLNAPGTHFTGNSVSGADDAVTIQGPGVEFADNSVVGSHANGVELSGAVDGLRFTGNTIQNSAGEGMLVLGAVTKSAFTGNRIVDNGQSDGTNGIYTLKPWTDVVFASNRVVDDQSSPTQKVAVYFRAGSRIAVVGNTTSGSATWASATAGDLVDIGSPIGGTSQWTCSGAGAPGVWSAGTGADEPAAPPVVTPTPPEEPPATPPVVTPPSDDPTVTPSDPDTSTPATPPADGTPGDPATVTVPVTPPADTPADPPATTAPTSTSVSIRVTPNRVSLSGSAIFTGTISPGSLGDAVVVDVKKPGSARWSYSSARLSYTASGDWWYRYTPRVRGLYAFRARFLGDADRGPAVSATVWLRVR